MPISGKFNVVYKDTNHLDRHYPSVIIFVDGVEYEADIYTGEITIDSTPHCDIADSDWDYYGYTDVSGDIYLSICDEDGTGYLVEADADVIGDDSYQEVEAIILKEYEND